MIEVETDFFPNGVKKQEIFRQKIGNEFIVGRDDDLPAIIHYSQSGEIRSEHFLKNGKYYSNMNTPSKIIYYPNGQIKMKEWYQDGKIGREGDLPGYIEYHSNGNLKLEEWYLKGVRDRDNNLPAKKIYYEDGNISGEVWFKDGFEGRDNDLPGCIDYYRNGKVKKQKWIQNGVLHRDGNKPAFIHYYLDGNIKSEIYYRQGLNFRFGRDVDYKPLPTNIYYHRDGKRRNQFIFVINEEDSDEGWNVLELEEKFYIKLLYLFRRKIWSYKKRKRNELKADIKDTKLEKAGFYVLNKVGEFVY